MNVNLFFFLLEIFLLHASHESVHKILEACFIAVVEVTLNCGAVVCLRGLESDKLIVVKLTVSCDLCGT